MKVYTLPKRLHPDFAVPGRKPVGPVEIDWGNSASRGLIGVYLFNEFPPRNLINGFNTFTPMTTGGALTTTIKGQAGTWDASNADEGVDPAINKIVDEYTIITLVYPRLSSSDSYGCTASIGDLSADIFRFQQLSTSTTQMRWRATDGSMQAWPDIDVVNNTWMYFVARRPIASGTAYGETYTEHGTLIGSVSKSMSASVPTAPVALTFGTQQGDAALRTDQDIAFTCIWNRQLSLEESQRVVRNPYQILKPAIPMQYVVPEAAPPSGFNPYWARNSNIILGSH